MDTNRMIFEPDLSTSRHYIVRYLLLTTIHLK